MVHLQVIKSDHWGYIVSQKQILRGLVGLGLALAAHPALALDLDAFVKHIEAAEDGPLFPGDARVIGETVVIDGFRASLGGTEVLLDGQFTFAGIAVKPHQGYVVDSITAPEIVFRDQSSGVPVATLEGLSIDGYISRDRSSPAGELYPFDLHAGPLRLLGVPFSVGALSLAIDPTLTNGVITNVEMSTAIKEVKMDLPDAPHPSDVLSSSLKALGMDAFTLDYSEVVSWQDDGRTTYSTQTRFGEFGTTQLEIVVDGLTQTKLQEIIGGLIAAQNRGSLGNPSNTGWIDPLLDLSIEEAGFRYDAGVLFPQLLDHLGSELEGRDALATHIENGIMAGIEALEAPAVTALARPALKAFLAEPSSLEARIDPPVPVRFMSVMGATMINKDGLVPLLGLTISTNEPTRADAP